MLAIIITVMVLSLRVPPEHDFGSLIRTTGHGLATYLLSFLYIAIYWYHHHRLFHLVSRVSSGVLWANLLLLFCLSLLPFTTAWMAHTKLAHAPLFVYGLNLLVAAGATFVLQSMLIRQEGQDSALRRAIGRNLRGKLSPALYLAGMLSAVLIGPPGRVGPYIALGCYAAVAVMWVIPNDRMERAVREADNG